jgi:uncharacterized membrane protein YphA (DoxX/SURF4 family)
MNSSIRKLASLPNAARLLQGLAFLVFGANGFLHFLPNPPGMPAPAADFAGALFHTGYMFPLIKGTEVVAGILLLSGRFVPLALTLLAPIIVNIIAFHAILVGGGLIGPPLLVLALELYLAWAYREAFLPMLRSRTEPAAAPRRGAAAPDLAY